MTDHATQRRPVRIRTSAARGQSIFPEFDVNVPMPPDTAVPGSYYKRALPPADAEAVVTTEAAPKA